jgi:hypothetical protein
MTNWKKWCLSLLLLGFSSLAQAASFTAAANGNWNIGTTWGGGCAASCVEGTDYPGASDTATIAAHTVTLAANQNVNNLNLSGGTLTLSTFTLNVAGNITFSGGSFNANTSTVVMNGTSAQTITSNGASFNNIQITNTSSGGVSFEDSTFITGELIVNVPGAAVYFMQGATHTVTGAFIVQGQAASKVIIDSIDGFDDFTLSVGSANVWTNADIADVTVTGTGSVTADISTDSGGNSGITFNTMPTGWSTNQAAVVAVGQTSMTTSTTGVTAFNLSSPQDIYSDGVNLYTAEKNNNRILIYNSIPASNNASSNVVIGQANMTTSSSGVTAFNMSGPRCVYSDGINLYEADYANNRVLIFNTLPTSNNASANVVIGQANMTSNASGISAFNMQNPIGIYSDGVKLYVADSVNSRILIFNSIPTTNNASANVVVGQANMTSSATGLTAFNMNNPKGIYSDGVKLYVADAFNNRVLIFNTVPTSNNASANVVVGQASMTTSTSGLTAFNMHSPRLVYSDGVKLYVTDQSNNRVLIFNTVPTSNNASADVVLGQANMTTSTAGLTANNLSSPASVSSDGVNLYVDDALNHRALLYNSALNISGTVYSDAGVTPLGSQTVEVAVNGVDTASTTSNASTGAYSVPAVATAGSVVTVYLKGMASDAVTVTVSPGGNNLSGVDLYKDYLITRQDDGGSLTNANLSTAATSGGSDISNIYSVSGSTLTVAAGKNLLVWIDDAFTPGGDIYAGGNVTLAGDFTAGSNSIFLNGTTAQTVTADGNSLNAVYVQNTTAAVTFADALTATTFTVNVPSASLKFKHGLTHTVSGAFVVQGQAAAKVTINSDDNANSFTLSVGSTNVWTNANIAHLTKSGAGSITANISTDSGSNSGITFNVATAWSTNQSANVAVGQANMTTSASGLTAFNINIARASYSDGIKLFVTDQNNNRILIYNTVPVSNNASANMVIGQANMTSKVSGITAFNMSIPRFVYSDGIKLFVSEEINNRVLIYNAVPTSNNASADVVVGQANMTTSASGLTAFNMHQAYSLYSDGIKLYVADFANNRVLIFNTIPTSNNVSANVVVGQPNMTTSASGVTGFNMSGPKGVYSDGVKLYVAEYSNNRILIFNTIPTSNNASANVVVGQANMTTNTSGITAFNMSASNGVYSDGVKLYVGDQLNNRVLIFNTVPSSNNASADVVLGQANMTSNGTGVTANNMNSPVGVYSDGVNLYVGDDVNNRILIFNSGLTIRGTVYSDAGVTPLAGQTVELAVNGTDTASTTSAGDGTYSVSATAVAGAVVTVYLKGGAADAVTVTVSPGGNGLTGVDLYQNYLIARQDNGSSLTNANLSTAATSGGADISSIYSVSGSTLTVAAGKNLLVWTGDTFAPGGDINAGGNVTLSGTFTSGGNNIFFNGTSAQTVTSNGNSFGDVYVQNTSAAVTFADALTATTFTVNVPSASLKFEHGLTHTVSGAFVVQGQTAAKVTFNSDDNMNTFTLSVGATNVWTNANIAHLTKAGAGSITADISVDGGSNSGVTFSGLTFSSVPTTSWTTNQSAAIVEGQANMTTSTSGLTAFNSSSPVSVYSDGVKMYSAESANNRIVIFNTIPSSNNASANVVVGQPDMVTKASGLTAHNLNTPYTAFSDGVKLYMTDRGNNRVLIFNTIPTSNNVSADVVVGQANMTTSSSALTAFNMNAPWRVYSDGVKLYVADTNNQRVLIFNTIPASNNVSADVVVGQANMTTKTSGLTAFNVSLPEGIYSDGVKLYVADQANNRVLIFNTIPTSNNASANVVVGQPDMVTKTSGLTAFNMQGPNNTYSDGVKLYVADQANNRILIFNTVPTSNNASANVVVGQPNMTTSTSGVTASAMTTPYVVYSDGASLYVGDVANNRVLIYNSVLSISGTVYSDAGVTALGSQTVEVAINGTDTASTTSNAVTGAYTVSVSAPSGSIVTVYLKGMAADGVTVTVGTGSNLSGVDIYQNYLIARQDNGGSLTNANLATAATGGGADVSNIYSVSGSTLTVGVGKSFIVWTGDTFAPGGDVILGGDVTLNGTFTPGGNAVYLNNTGTQSITSNGNSFNTLYVQNTSAAVSFLDALTASSVVVNVPSASLKFKQGVIHTVSGSFVVQGQAAAKVAINSVNGSSAFTLSVSSTNVWTNANIAHLTKAGAGSITANISTDSGGNSGITFNTMPTTWGTNQQAATVIGQANMTSNGSGLTAFNMNGSQSIYSDGVKLYITDGNNRVLIFNTIPASNNASADVVVGQANMTTSAAGLTAFGLNAPRFAYSDGVKLYVSDRSNNRVLIFNTIPASNNASADVVVGQADMTHNVSGLTAFNMQNPRGLYSDGVKLYVADFVNNRVLIFNTVPASNNVSANVVIGQANMTTSTSGITAFNMQSPYEIYSDGVKLYVADQGNNRVLIFNTVPTSNNASANVVVGQANMTSNGSGLTAFNLQAPNDVYSDGVKLYVVDAVNNRLLIYNTVPTSNNTSADVVVGQGNMTTSASGITANNMDAPVIVNSDGVNLYVADKTNNRVLIYNNELTISGTVYSDAGVTGLGNQTVEVAINGVDEASTTSTAGTGAYSVQASAPSGSVVTVYLKGMAADAVTATVASGANLTGIDLYQDYLRAAGSNATLATAATSGGSDISNIYSVSGSTLTVAAGKNLMVPASNLFAPGGDIYAGGHVTLNGTFTASTNNVFLNGTAAQTVTSNGNSFNALYDQNTTAAVTFADALTATTFTVNVPSASLKFKHGVTSTVSGAFLVYGQSAANVTINSDDNTNTFTLSVGATNVWTNATIAHLTKSGAGSITANNASNSGNNSGITFNAATTWGTSQSAVVAVGQPNLTTRGSALTAFNVSNPAVAFSDGVKLYEAEFSNNRVLIFNTIPTSSNASANVVVGQADMTHSVTGITAFNLHNPVTVYSDGLNLYVADDTNNRVLIYNTIPTSNNVSANVVVGQANMTTSTTAVTAFNLKGVTGVYSDGVKLYVTDNGNQRVLIFNTIPMSNNASANVVVGQVNMTSAATGVTAFNMHNPENVYSDGVKLYAIDQSNNRVLIFNTVPTTNNASANVVVGQADMTHSGTGITAFSLNNPYNVYSDGTKLYVAESGNNRVLIFNTVPTTNNASANVVIGQANMTTSTTGVTANTLNFATDVLSDGVNLYVVDQNNNRILIYNSELTISGTVYSDAGVTALAAQTVEIAVNGTDTTSAVSAGDGTYSASVVAAAGAVVTVYLKGMAADAVTVTVSTGGNAISGVDLYKDYLIARQDNGGSLTNANLSTAATGGGADVSNIYSVSGSTLTVAAGKNLLVWTGDTFAPGGDIYAGGNVTLTGTFTPGGNNVFLNGTTAQTVTSNGNSFNTVNDQNISAAVTFADALNATSLIANVPSASMKFKHGVTHTVSGSFVVQGQAAAKITINSDDNTNAFTLSVGSTNVWTNATISHLTESGAGSITANISTNSGSNSGVTFNTMPTTWVTNQPGNVVVGQPNMTSNASGVTARNTHVARVAYSDGIKLYVADQANSRVLIFNTIPTSNNASADVVVGQANMTSNGTGVTAFNMANPVTGVYSDGVKMYVSDWGNNRVFIFNTIPTSNNASANVVVGQANMTSNASGITAFNMQTPGSVYSDGVKLYVGDYGNNRVLIFNTIPTSNNASANVVVGQADMTHSVTGVTAFSMHGPDIVYTDGVKLYVSDFNSNRVLIYNTVPTSNNASANVVVGQANMTTSASGLTGFNINTPIGVYSDGVKLYVEDALNNRCLIYNSVPASNNVSVDVVLGQVNMTTSASGITANNLNLSDGIYSDGVKLYVADSSNNRFLIYNSTSSVTISGTVYSDVGVTPLGSQTVELAVNGVDAASTTSAVGTGTYSVSANMSAGAVVTVYLKGGANDAVTVTVGTGSNITGVDLYQNYLIARQDNGGSLANADLSTAATSGGSDISNIYTVSGSTLTLAAGKSLLVWTGDTFAPGGDIYAGGHVALNGTFTPGANTVYLNGTAAQTVTSNGNGFNALYDQNTSAAITFADALTTTTFTANVPSASLKFEHGVTSTVSGAFVVRGQAAAKVTINSDDNSNTFTLNVGTDDVWTNANIAHMTATGSGSVTANISTDSGSNSNVTFNASTTWATNQSAVVAVGQANLTSSGSGITGFNVHGAGRVYSDGVKLYVSDETNNRVLIYNTIPSSNNVSADVVVGQANMTSSITGLTAFNFDLPKGISADGVRLYVADALNNRILIYTTIPTSNNVSADVVVGQANMTTSASGLTARNFQTAYGVYSDGVKLYVADQVNNRVLIFNSIPTTNNASADVVVGQANMTTSTSGLTAFNLSGPLSVYVDGVKLYVSENGNNRVLIFNTIPTSNNASANVVVGQANMTTSASGLTARNVDNPHSAYSDGASFYVSDFTNHRVLIFNAVPTSNNTSADIVLGQPNMTTSTSGVTANNTATDSDGYSDGVNLYVPDFANNRVLIFNSELTISGTTYSDAGVTPLTSQTVELAVNGVDTASTTSNAVTGAYSITAAVPQGAVVTVYLKGMAADAVTVTVAPNATTLSGVNIYQDYLIVRQDNGGSLTNANLSTAATGGGADVSNIYSVSGSTLTVAAGKNLLVWSGDTFAPGGDINAGGSVTLTGTFTSGGNNIFFNGTAAQTVTSNGNSFGDVFVQNTSAAVTFADAMTATTFTVNVPSASLKFEHGTTHTVSGAFVVKGQAAAKVSINSDDGTNPFTLNIGSTTDVWTFANIANLTESGTGSITADLSTDSGGNTGVTFNASTTWVTQQSAAVVVGQANMTTSASGLTAFNMAGAESVYSDGAKLFVANQTNQRVLIFNTIPTSNNASANVVVGQADMTHNTSGLTAFNMSNPSMVSSDGIKMYVTDQANNRILIFNTIPTANNASADVVVGQANMTTSASGLTARNLSGPRVVYSDGVKLYVIENLNNRLLIFNTIPTANNASADVVVGQANMTTSAAGTTAHNLQSPAGVYTDGVKLYVAEASNNRVLIFNTVPTSNNASANVVVGQANMTTSTSGVTAFNMQAPFVVYSDGTKLYVGDRANNRVLIFNTVPASNNASANVVIGQANMTSNGSGLTATNFNAPYGLFNDGVNLYVGDYSNNRVLIFNSEITVSGTVYSDAGVTALSGQTVELGVNGTDTASAVSAGDGTYSITAAVPAGAVVTLYLKGGAANAVTVTVAPNATTLSGVDLYQNYLITRQDNGGSLTNANLSTAATGGGADISSIYSVSGSTLTVAAGENLLVWSGDTFAPGGDINAGGNVTLSGTFTSGGNNIFFKGTSSQTVTSNGNSFGDVYVQNTSAAVSFADAMTATTFTVNVPSASVKFKHGVTHTVSGAFVVLGQPAAKVSINSDNGSGSFTLSVGATNVWINANISHLTATGAGSITANISVNSGSNSGVTFNIMPTIWSTNQSANVVVGQANMTTSTSALTGFNINRVNGLYSDGIKLYVGDRANNRILIFNAIPTSNNASANVVVGQADMTHNASGLTAFNLNGAVAATTDGVKLYVTDASNNRILIFNSIPASNNVSADVVVGQPNMTTSASGLTAFNMAGPADAYSDGVKLYVTDELNNRVLIFNTIPTSNNASANVVVGQANMTTSASGITGFNLNTVTVVRTDGVKLFLADDFNNRVLIYNTVPTSNNASANVVVGQANMTSNGSGLTAFNVHSTSVLFTDGVKLYVADQGNNRALIFNTVPTSNNASADVVIGQANMTTSTSGVTASTLSSVVGVNTDGVNLYLGDRLNDRVLIYNSSNSNSDSSLIQSMIF